VLFPISRLDSHFIAPGSAVPRKFTVIPRGAADADVITEEQTETDESLDVPWNVVVHNDPINLMEYVTKVFMKIFGFTRQKAEVHMIEVHQRGRSVVWSGQRERAEFYVQQLHEYLLLATIEKSR
jgi:ATP-dependent Clp protease adaptor protein ClpS